VTERDETRQQAIGSTPIMQLRRIVPAGAAEIWVKLE
jgi:cysteine synthase